MSILKSAAIQRLLNQFFKTKVCIYYETACPTARSCYFFKFELFLLYLILLFCMCLICRSEHNNNNNPQTWCTRSCCRFFFWFRWCVLPYCAPTSIIPNWKSIFQTGRKLACLTTEKMAPYRQKASDNLTKQRTSKLRNFEELIAALYKRNSRYSFQHFLLLM